MKRLDLVRRLEQSGCVLLRHGGRHDIYHNPKTGRSEPVEETVSDDGTWKSIRVGADAANGFYRLSSE